MSSARRPSSGNFPMPHGSSANRARAKVVQNENTRNNKGICVEAHDLAASKLVAFREKDREFVRVLLAKRMIRAEKLIRVLNLLEIPRDERNRLIQWTELTSRELGPTTMPGGAAPA